MKYDASSISEYLTLIADDKKEAFVKLQETIQKHIPKGFEETMSYGMIGYVVPHSLYPDGYHCDPKLPLPFISIAAQKNFIALYHMGMYTDSDLVKWFTTEFPKHSKYKLDMGKCCIRFKKPEAIPFKLTAELVSKVSVFQCIDNYKTQIKR